MIYAWFTVMCLIFSTTFLAIKVGIIAGAPPLFSGGLRFFFAGLLLFTYFVWRHRVPLSLLWRRDLALTGFFYTFATFAGLYWGEQYISSGLAAVLSATGPLMVVVLQALVTRQTVARHVVVGMLLSFSGVLLLMLPNMTIGVGFLWLAGCIAVLVGEMGYACGALYSKRTAPRFQGISPIALNGVQMMYGGVMLFTLSALTEDVAVAPFQSVEAIGALLYLTIVGSMVGHSIFYWLVVRTNPIFPSLWLYISPVIALLIGAAIYDEPLTAVTLVGTIVIICGLIICNWQTISTLMKRSDETNEYRKVYNEG